MSCGIPIRCGIFSLRPNAINRAETVWLPKRTVVGKMSLPLYVFIVILILIERGAAPWLQVVVVVLVAYIQVRGE